MPSRGESQSLQPHSHRSRRDGGLREAPFRTPAHRAVPGFWPSVCRCVPPTTVLGIARSSQESKASLSARWCLRRFFLQGVESSADVFVFVCLFPLCPPKFWGRTGHPKPGRNQSETQQRWSEWPFERGALHEGCCGAGAEGHTVLTASFL